VRWAPGAREFSTCLDLDLPLIHDVNSWYSSLGVNPRASRREIAYAYADLSGQDDVWLTHCVTQLLHRDTRLAYDRCRLGTRFWDEAEKLSARRALLHLLSASPVEPVDFARVLDTGGSPGEGSRTGGWGYYSPAQSEDRMARWRTQLASAAHSRQLHRSISVGEHHDGQPWEIRAVDGLTVFSLHRTTDPSPHAALEALSAWREPSGQRHTPMNPTYPTNTQNEDDMTQAVNTEVEDFEGDFESSYGGEVAKEASKKNSGSFSGRVKFFSLDPEAKQLVRFLSDSVKHPENPRMIPWITVDQHSGVPTKPKPADYQGTKWPEHMGAVCRKSKAFQTRYPDGCPIEDANLVDSYGKKIGRASSRTWALVALREEVYEDVDGRKQLVGVKTVMDDVVIDGVKVGETPAIRQMNMGFNNFFAHLDALAARYKTVLNRDIEITRSGGGKNTAYNFAPLDIVQRADGSVFDLREVSELERFEATIVSVESGKKVEGGKIPDLRRCVTAQVNDDYYEQWFGMGSGAAAKSGEASEGSAAPAQPQGPAQGSAEDDEKQKARMAEMRARIQAGGKVSEPAASPAADPEPPAVAAASGARSFD
jgi:hypothetical protein